MIKIVAPIHNLNGEQVAYKDAALTFKDLVLDTMNLPPHVFPTKSEHPRHTAELRASIIRKLSDASDTVEF